MFLPRLVRPVQGESAPGEVGLRGVCKEAGGGGFGAFEAGEGWFLGGELWGAVEPGGGVFVCFEAFPGAG